MSDREELLNILRENLMSDDHPISTWENDFADAIINAGFRKPRVVDLTAAVRTACEADNCPYPSCKESYSCAFRARLIQRMQDSGLISAPEVETAINAAVKDAINMGQGYYKMVDEVATHVPLTDILPPVEPTPAVEAAREDTEIALDLLQAIKTLASVNVGGSLRLVLKAFKERDAAMIERCAKVAEAEHEQAEWNLRENGNYGNAVFVTERIATTIRALKTI